MEKLYKILVTGTPIGGKTSVAKKLEKDLVQNRLNVVNRDVDYDIDWGVIPSNTDVYLLQTPHGSSAEQEDGIKLSDFNKIWYVSPDDETQKEFLKSRAIAWFNKGVTEVGVDKNPQPRSLAKLPGILENILEYAYNIPRIFKEDESFIKEGCSRKITPELIDNQLYFEGYEEALIELLKDVRS